MGEYQIDYLDLIRKTKWYSGQFQISEELIAVAFVFLLIVVGVYVSDKCAKYRNFNVLTFKYHHF